MSSNDEKTDVQLDIGKYDGHTPGPWKWDEFGVLQAEESVLWVDFLEPDPDWQINNSAIHAGEEDEILIADAPLLLEEVKRLRNKIRLLDIVEDRDGALDSILLNTNMLTEEELKGAYSDSELVGVEFHN